MKEEIYRFVIFMIAKYEQFYSGFKKHCQSWHSLFITNRVVVCTNLLFLIPSDVTAPVAPQKPLHRQFAHTHMHGLPTARIQLQPQHRTAYPAQWPLGNT
jgi:hypothetical protein